MKKTREELEHIFDALMQQEQLDQFYMDFIMLNGAALEPERSICDGDSLLRAFEAGMLYDEFKDAMITRWQAIQDHRVQ